MWILLGTVFVASLLGSLHCVGMCGPFALVAGADSSKRKAAVLPTAAYSFGRLVTYSVIGLISGLLGMALNRGLSFSSVQQAATYAAGALMVAVGVVSLTRYLGMQIKLPQIFAPIQKSLRAAYARTTAMKPVSRAFAIGMLTSLMPCGWLYTFAITAAGTGSPFWGLILMVAFWAGTVPIMTMLMLGLNQVGHRFRHRLPAVMASLVILLGIFTLSFRAPVVVGADPVVITGTDNLVEQIKSIEHHDLPCCSKE